MSYKQNKAARKAAWDRFYESPGKYRCISASKLREDLKGRTLSDIYRDNRSSRSRCKKTADIEARGETNAPPPPSTRSRTLDLFAYTAWCEAIGHAPHPASIDRTHPHHKQTSMEF